MKLPLVVSLLLSTPLVRGHSGLQCSDLEGLRAEAGIPYGTDFNATRVAAGALVAGGTPMNNTVPLCRIQGAMSYGCRGNDTLLFEVWLPEGCAYNGRYISVGGFRDTDPFTG